MDTRNQNKKKMKDKRIKKTEIRKVDIDAMYIIKQIIHFFYNIPVMYRHIF